MTMKNKKIGVLMGGISKEREISFKTGRAVLAALQRQGYQAFEIDAGIHLAEQLKTESVEIAFICLHGNFGEDGTVQGLLEWLGIPYTGSGVLASALAMDKAILNRLVAQVGVTIPREKVFVAGDETLDHFIHSCHDPLPLVVKPAREGSTINVSIVRKQTDLRAAVEQALQSDTKVLVEEFIVGKEITVSVLNGRALPIIEIAPKSGFYDYQSKYTKGMTDYIIPAGISEACQEKVQGISERLYRMIDCAGVVRADFMVQEKTEVPYFLEINTIPGMTETSLVPKAAAHAGINFDPLVVQILNGAALKIKR